MAKDELAEPVYIIVQIPAGQTYHDVLQVRRLLAEFSDQRNLRLGSTAVRPEGMSTAEGEVLYERSTWEAVHNIFLYIIERARDLTQRRPSRPRHERKSGA